MQGSGTVSVGSGNTSETDNATTDPKADNDMNKPTTSAPRLSVVAQALTPKTEALTWLSEAQAAGTQFRVPVEIAVSPLGVSGGSLGFGSDRIEVSLDDSALGIGLSDRARDWCGDSETCAMWLWATWKDGTLVVFRAEGAIAPADRGAATHIHVAK